MKYFDVVGPEKDLWDRVLGALTQETIGVEIGCLYGDSANVILKASPHTKLTSIDPFLPDPMEASLIGSILDSIEKNKTFIEGGRLKILQEYSWNVVNDWGSNSLDFLFIDGDHRYEGVLRDYNEWEPKLKIGGLLFMHDSRMGRDGGANFWEGPSKVAQELIFSNPDKWEVVDEAFSLTCVRKLK